MLLGISHSAPIAKTIEGWKIEQKDYLTGMLDITIDGDMVCYKSPELIKERDASAIRAELERRNGTRRGAEMDSHLMQTSRTPLKNSMGNKLAEVDITRDGCFRLDKEIGRYYFGFGTTIFEYGNITISVDMVENWVSVVEAHTDYEVCSNSTLTPGIVEAIFVNKEGSVELPYSAVLQYRNYTYNQTVQNWTCENETLENGTVVQNCTENPYSVEMVGWDYSPVEDFTGCSIIRVEGHRNPNTAVDNQLCVYEECWEEWAWWNSSWGYCMNVNISSGFPANYSHLIALNTTNFDYSHAKSDLADLRVLEGTCTSPNTTMGELGIWNETINTSGESRIWFMTQTANISSVAIYYNNSAVSATFNGSNAFLFFDHFEGAALSGDWFDMGGTTESVANSIVHIVKGAIAYSGIATHQTFSQGKKVLSYCQVEQKGTFLTGFSTNTTGGYAVNAAEPYWVAGTNKWANEVSVDSVAKRNATSQNGDANWHRWLYYWTADGCNFTINETYYTGAFTTDTPSVDLPLTIRHGADDVYCDLVAVGNAELTEPTYTFGSEESDTPAGSFSFTNYTFSTPQYEGLSYNYTVNFTIGGSDDNSTATYLVFNGKTITASCANVSKNYSCNATNIPAPLTATNGTDYELKWQAYTYSGGNLTIQNQTFNTTVYHGFWATNMSSDAQIAELNPATVNVSYSNVSGFDYSYSAEAYIGSSSGSLSCSGGECTGSITAPDVSSATVYQVEANFTLTSAYWSSSLERPVRVENTYYKTATDALMGEIGTPFNPNNANDSNWGTYAQLIASEGLEFNYSMSGLFNITEWQVKDEGAKRQYTIPEDCWREDLSFRVVREGTTFTYYCQNYTDDSYATLGTFAFGDLFYEQNMTYVQNNSLIRVVPFGLTDCSIGRNIMTFFIKNEDTDAAVVANYTQQFFLTVGNATYGHQFIGEDDEWNVCVYPSDLNATFTSIEQYSVDGYGIRSYAIATETSTETHQNYTRYLGYGSSAYTFIVRDNFGTDLEDATATVYKFNFITNEYEVVSSVLSDYTGTIVFYLIPFDNYRFAFSKSGYETLQFDLTPSTITEIIVILSYATEMDFDNWEYVWNDVAASIEPISPTHYTDPISINYTVFSNSSNLSYFGMRIIRYVNGTGTQVYFQNTTGSPAGGKINYTADQNGTYHVYTWFKHAQYPLQKPFAKVYSISGLTGILKSKEDWAANPPISGWVYYLIAVVVAALAGGYISQFTVDGAGIVSVLTLWVFTWFNPDAEIVCIAGNSACITPVHITLMATVAVIAALYMRRSM